MDGYRIIDEPKARFSSQLIVNPLAIFLVAMFLPMFFTPPYYGRVWMPFLWLIVNGVLLGSPTLKKEIAFSVAGTLLWLFLPITVVVLLNSLQMGDFWELLRPYIHICRQAIFFFFLYLIVNAQSLPYGLHQYLKEHNQS